MTGTISGNAVPDRIAALREVMRQRGLAACIIPTEDPHMSEYISDHYKSREFITGFTGSAGTAVITGSDAGLWTDSRYWLQAAQELEGSGVSLFRDGQPDTPSLETWICEQLGGGADVAVVCACGTMLSAARADALREAFHPCGIRLETGLDPIREIWLGRPPLELREIKDHPVKYAGLSRTEKIDLIREDLSKLIPAADSNPDRAAGPAALILSSLDDIAWLLNLRGTDIPCNPVFYSFVIMTDEEVRLYTATDRVPASLMQTLAKDDIRLLPYESFYEDLAHLENTAAILDPDRCSEQILQCLPASARLIKAPSPVMLRKCVKNPVEMDGIRAAHIRDGVAMCRFLFWLKQQMDPAHQSDADSSVTELSAARQLLAFRAEQELFAGESFDPIVACGPHGAIVHYSATEATDVLFRPEGLLLIDSGAQYLDGTTDITRTIALGPLTEEEKRCFTAVLRGHINLARARFRRGCTGASLDVLAHQPLWEHDLDYGHGTGHGVGAYLNVHEDPLRIHWAAGRSQSLPPFAEGMLVSDEPGCYEADRFGIRHENLLLCVPAQGAPSIDLLQFEPVTLVPFDLAGIDPALMQPVEIAWLDAYHQRVRETISPHLNEAERAWLAEATRPIRSV